MGEIDNPIENEGTVGSHGSYIGLITSQYNSNKPKKMGA